jgi:hypothetical protein
VTNSTFVDDGALAHFDASRRHAASDSSAAEDDAAWFKANPDAAACIRLIARCEYPDALNRTCLVFVAPWLGGWHVEPLPFQLPDNAERIALDSAGARMMLTVMRDALPGQSYREARARTLRLYLHAVPAGGAA